MKKIESVASVIFAILGTKDLPKLAGWLAHQYRDGVHDHVVGVKRAIDAKVWRAREAEQRKYPMGHRNLSKATRRALGLDGNPGRGTRNGMPWLGV